MRRFGRIRRDEAGFTLIELLISMIVIAVGVLAVLGALGFGIESGEGQRTTSAAELTLRSFAEHVKAAQYEPCAVPEDYETGFDPPYPDKTPVVTVAEILFWDGNPDSPAVEFVGECPADPDTDRLQQILLMVEADFGGSIHQTLVVKRDATP